MHIETAVLGCIQDPWRNKQAKGNSDDQVERLRWRPASEGVNLMYIEIQLSTCHAFDRNYACSATRTIDWLILQNCLPSRICFSPRPTRLSFLQTTSIEATFSGFSFLILFRAFSEYMLNSSAPQKSIRRGSCWGELDRYRLDEPHLRFVKILLLVTKEARFAARNAISTRKYIKCLTGCNLLVVWVAISPDSEGARDAQMLPRLA